MRIRKYHGRRPCTFLHACNCKYLIQVGYNLTDASIMLGVNIGSLSHIMHEICTLPSHDCGEELARVIDELPEILRSTEADMRLVLIKNARNGT